MANHTPGANAVTPRAFIALHCLAGRARIAGRNLVEFF
jgi:hypothetical protein